ncbi:hypothetical protein J5N97_028932 [Dioscorea zingiberensis]|uniref:Major facilitator superfamily (MFS) profile domain-containing protein n=1 Tax=Dioscorea zingiberensis TaxID=325984 RepID=A0A9D5H5F8_9LILI|nr:hypothetical protein J5N97_028932 [Dioscorea zingiberensis]
MAGGVVANASGGGKDYPGKMTLFVFLACLIAATGGLIFGYDLGISGGVTSMDPFLLKFFPSVYKMEKANHSTNQYCKFDSEFLTLFTSSLYLAALVSSFFASTVTRVFGRKWSMFYGGITFLLGSVINGGAQDIFMLILGRLLLGVGVGFANQSVPLYLSEMAPARLRGMLNIGFQLMITIGIFAANLINYATSKIEGGWGWRVSLALAAVPATVITLGSFFLPDTPNSLIERGYKDQAKEMLCKIRGTEDIQMEYDDLLTASEEAQAIKHPWSNILKRKYRPQLTMAILIPFFQQLTGINVIMFYAPVLFKTIGFGDDASLMSAVITGLVNVFATFVSIATVDKVGRRTLLLQGGIQMFICQILVGTMIAIMFGTSGETDISKKYAFWVVVFICIYVSGFAWSWGPLGWLVPSEIFSMEIRSAGQSITVSVNMFFTFIIGQIFLTMLCHMKFGLFYFFGGWRSFTMAGMVVVNASGGKDYPGKMTLFVFLTCLVASTGGLIFGYDIGISGGVIAMDPFLLKFFPSVYELEKSNQSTDQYCKFDSKFLTLFTSSLYLAALVSSFFASTVTRVFGRKWSMFYGGITFLMGSVINCGAQDLFMLILGRLLLGVGVGFTNQSVPLYLSEMAPARLRGMLSIGFQLMITIGILAANLINYGTAQIEGGWGWRVSLALAAVPATIITLGSFFLPDTPNSLIERGYKDKAKEMLYKIRGTEDIQMEYDDMLTASKEAKAIKHPWSNILKRKYRPQLTMAILIPFFQQFTGINVIMFYAPIIFMTIGFEDDASLMSVVITGLVVVFGTSVSIAIVDKFGRRMLFLQGGIQMFICQIIVGTMIGILFGTNGATDISKEYAPWVVIFICIYVAGFAWSWGSLGWLVPSEIFSMEIRSVGQSITVSVNMLCTFIIGQIFLKMLCYMKFRLFYFFGGWIVVMTIFIALFLPETKNVPIEEMILVWKNHWFWGRFVNDGYVHVANGMIVIA